MPASAAVMLIQLLSAKAALEMWGREPGAHRGQMVRMILCVAARALLAVGVTGVGLTGELPAQAAAQSFLVSPRVAVMEGDAFALSVGLRGEVGSTRLAVYAQGGLFRLTSTCETSLPPLCTSPSSGGVELLGGVRLSLPGIGPTHPAISLGAGALLWEDTQPYKSGVGSIWEGELRAGVKLFAWSDLVLAATLRNIGQSVTGGMRLERDRGTYVGIMAGLLIPVR